MMRRSQVRSVQRQQHRCRLAWFAPSTGRTGLLFSHSPSLVCNSALVVARRTLFHASRPVMSNRDKAALLAVFDSFKFVNKEILPKDPLTAENVNDEVVDAFRAVLSASRFNRKDTSKRNVNLSLNEHRLAQLRWCRRYVLHVSFEGRETVTTAARWAALGRDERSAKRNRSPEADVHWVTSEGKDLQVGPEYRKLLGNSGVKVPPEKTALTYHHLEPMDTTRLTAEEHAYVEKHFVDRSGKSPHSVNAMPFSPPLNSDGQLDLEAQTVVKPSKWSASDFVLDIEDKTKQSANRLAERFPLASPLDGSIEASVRSILGEYCGDVSSPWPNEFSIDLTSYVDLLEFEYVSNDWDALESVAPVAEPGQSVHKSYSRFKTSKRTRSGVVLDLTHLSTDIQTADVIMKPLGLERAKHSLSVLQGYKELKKDDIASGVAVCILERLRDELGLVVAGGLGPTVFLSKLACNECVRRLPAGAMKKKKSILKARKPPQFNKASILERAQLLKPATVCNSPVWGNEAPRIVSTRAKNCEEWVRTTITSDSHRKDGVFLVDYRFPTSASTQQFMTVLPVCEIPLLGPSQVRLLETVLGIRYLGDLTMDAMSRVKIAFGFPFLRVLSMANTGGLHIPHEAYHGAAATSPQTAIRVFVGRITPHSIVVATGIKIMRSLLLELSSRELSVQNLRVFLTKGTETIPHLNFRETFDTPPKDETAVLEVAYNYLMRKEVQLTRGMEERRLNIIVSSGSPTNQFVQKRKMLERTAFLPYGSHFSSIPRLADAKGNQTESGDDAAAARTGKRRSSKTGAGHGSETEETTHGKRRSSSSSTPSLKTRTITV